MNRVKRFFAAPIFDDEDKTRVASMLNAILLAALVLSVVFSIVALITFPKPEVSIVLTGALALPQLGALFLMRRGRVQLAGILFSSMLWGFATLSAFIAGGVSSSGFGTYTIIMLMAGLLLGWRAGMVFVGLSIVAGLGLLYAETSGVLPPSLLPTTPVSIWAAQTAIFIVAATLLYLATRSLNDALQRVRSSNRELQGIRQSLEHQVAERTADLQQRAADLSLRGQELEAANTELEKARQRQEAINRELQATSDRIRRRAAQLQAVAEVSRAIAQVRDLEHLLPHITRLISQHFDYYHVGIFMVDQARRYAVLQAANSEGGRRMLARNHKLLVGGQGIVGYATGTGEPRVALDVGTDAVFFNNPDLPDTRSEVALPLRIGDQTIGALDVQSVEAQAFDRQDVAVLSTLADQVAVAIQNTWLFQQSQEALVEAEKAQRRYLQQTWQGFLQQRAGLQFEYTLEGVPSALDVELPTTRQALAQGELVAASDVEAGAAVATSGDDDSRSRFHAVVRAALSVPIKLRGQVIGVLDLHQEDETRVWTEHEVGLVQAVADQMAQAVEAVRLFEEAQARAHREQLVGQITARMRATSDVQDILRVASEELGKTLGVARSVVRLRPQGTPEASTATPASKQTRSLDNGLGLEAGAASEAGVAKGLSE